MQTDQQNDSNHSNTTEQTADQELSKLTDIIDEDIETLVSLRLQAEQEAGSHQRMVERLTDNLGRPPFLYLILLFVILWVISNILGSLLHVLNLDAPPFFWLQGLIGLSALLMTTTVLITQNRQQKMADQRRHLDLAIALMTDRKVSKLIEIVQKLRVDMPQVENHYDAEANAMQEKTDPDKILTTLEQTLKEASRQE